MTIVQFQYILAVDQYKNFTTAAEKCFVTQPTLSMQVQKLEEELDILIFDRSKKPIETTEVGKKIINQARAVVTEAERIKDIISQYKGYIGGDFKLGIIPTIAPTLLPMFLGLFVKKYPKVELIIEELTTQDIIKGILEGSLDAGILATPLEQPNIVERPLFNEPFVAYIPKNHRLGTQKRIHTSDLKTDDILMLEDGHCFRNNVLNICKNNATGSLKEPFEIKSGSFETLIRLSNEGLGMTLLPYLHTQEIREEYKENLHYFSQPVPAREISLIYNANQLKIGMVNALYEVIASVVRGVIALSWNEEVKIVSPLQKKKNA